MKKGWTETTLREVVTCKGGTSFPPALQGRESGAIPFYKVSDMNAPRNTRFMHAANNYVNPSDLPRLKGQPHAPFSVVFPKVGGALLTNKKRMLSRPSLVDNNIMVVTSIDTSVCNPHFLLMLFESIDLRYLSNPGPLPSINAARVYERDVSLPPLPEQKRIAAVLLKIQRAIETQEKIIQSLRDLKKSTMQHVFTRGLRGEKTKMTEFGPIPESWQIEPLGKCCTVQTGIAKGRKIADHEAIELPYLRVANVQDGHLNLTEMKTIRLRALEKERYSLRDGDIVLTEGGDFDKLGRGFVWEGQVPDCVHQNHVFAVRPDKSRLLPHYLAYLVQSLYGKAYFLKVAHKTTNLACINTTKLKGFPVAIPHRREQENLVHSIGTIDAKLVFHESKKSAFQDLFKTTLNKLMTGDIRIQDLDIDVSEVEE